MPIMQMCLKDGAVSGEGVSEYISNESKCPVDRKLDIGAYVTVYIN